MCDLDAALAVTFRPLPDQQALEATFSLEANRSYPTLEILVANYFTPHHTPRFAVSDTRVDPAHAVPPEGRGRAGRGLPVRAGRVHGRCHDTDRLLASASCQCADVSEVYGIDGAVAGNRVTRYDRDAETCREVDIDANADVDHTEQPDRLGDDPCYFYFEVEHFAFAVTGESRPNVDAENAHRVITILGASYVRARTAEKVSSDGSGANRDVVARYEAVHTGSYQPEEARHGRGLAPRPGRDGTAHLPKPVARRMYISAGALQMVFEHTRRVELEPPCPHHAMFPRLHAILTKICSRVATTSFVISFTAR